MKKKTFDHKKIEEVVKMMFEAIGENPKRVGIKKTPERVASAFEEIFEAVCNLKTPLQLH